MSAMAALDLVDTVTVSTSEASRQLCISRARLAELVLSNELELVGPQDLTNGRVRLRDLDRLAEEILPPGGVRATSRAAAGQLSRAGHAMIHLIADWGAATRVSLQYAMRQQHPSTLGLVANLIEGGFIQEAGRDLVLTVQGRNYVEVHARVS